MVKRRTGVIVLLMGCALCAAADGPTSQPGSRTTQPASQPFATLSAPVQTAVEALVKEYEKVKADPTKPPRVKCDYYAATKKPPGQDEIMAAVGADLDPDPLTSAYVKWQLLSAFRGTVSEKNVPVIAEEYQPLRRLPVYIRSDPGVVKRLATMAQGVHNAEAATKLNSGWKQEVAKYDATYGHLAAYRNELYRCLPKNRDNILLGLTDLQQRCLAGWDPGGLTKAVAADARIWATPLDSKETIPVVARLRELAGYKGLAGFGDYTWDAKNNSGKFKAYVPTLDSRTMNQAIEAIKNAFK